MKQPHIFWRWFETFNSNYFSPWKNDTYFVKYFLHVEKNGLSRSFSPIWAKILPVPFFLRIKECLRRNNDGEKRMQLVKLGKWGSMHCPPLYRQNRRWLFLTRQSNQCGFSIYIFDNSNSKSKVRLVRAEKMVLSGLVYARKIARMILI